MKTESTALPWYATKGDAFLEDRLKLLSGKGRGIVIVIEKKIW
jgi:hypothetical protein